MEANTINRGAAGLARELIQLALVPVAQVAAVAYWFVASRVIERRLQLYREDVGHPPSQRSGP